MLHVHLVPMLPWRSSAAVEQSSDCLSKTNLWLRIKVALRTKPFNYKFIRPLPPTRHGMAWHPPPIHRAEDKEAVQWKRDPPPPPLQNAPIKS